MDYSLMNPYTPQQGMGLQVPQAPGAQSPDPGDGDTALYQAMLKARQIQMRNPATQRLRSRADMLEKNALATPNTIAIPGAGGQQMVRVNYGGLVDKFLGGMKARRLNEQADAADAADIKTTTSAGRRLFDVLSGKPIAWGADE